MTNAQTLESLVQTLEHQNKSRRDYIASPKSIRMIDGLINCQQTEGGIYVPNEVMHQHIMQKLKIPADYYRRMRYSKVSLLDSNVNGWLDELDEKNGLMLRTFEYGEENIGRALLSDRYGIVDNYDVMFAALDTIERSKIKVEIKECTVTDKRMYLHITAPDVEIDARESLKGYLRDRGDAVGYGIIAGLVISNSEVGWGSFEINPRAVIIRCNNGMICPDDSFRKVHLGAKLSAGAIKWSEDTKEKNMDLILSQTRDAIKQFLSEGYLSGMVQKVTDAAKQKLDNPVDTVQNVIEVISKKVGSIDDARKRSILDHFIKGGDTAASGVFHSLTMEAQFMDADNRYAMEEQAFSILPKIKSFDKPFKVSKN